MASGAPFSRAFPFGPGVIPFQLALAPSGLVRP